MDGGISGQRLLDVLIAHVFAVPASIAPGDVVEAGDSRSERLWPYRAWLR